MVGIWVKNVHAIIFLLLGNEGWISAFWAWHSSFSHHLFLSVRKELEEKNPTFSLLLPLGLRQYDTCYCPKPEQKHTEIVIYVTEKKGLSLIQHFGGTEKLYTEKKPASLFHLASFPRKLPLLHLCFTQHIPCTFFYNLHAWMGKLAEEGQVIQ